MDSLAKDIACGETRCARDTIFTLTTVGIGTISYDDFLVTSRVQRKIYGSILHSNIVT